MFRTLPESVPRRRLLSSLTARRRTRRIRTLSRTHLGTRWTPPATRAPVSPQHPLHQDLEPMIPAARKMIVLYLRYLTQFPSLMRFPQRRFQLIRIVRWRRTRCHSLPSLGQLHPLAFGRPRQAALVPALLRPPSAGRYLAPVPRVRGRRRPFPPQLGKL